MENKFEPFEEDFEVEPAKYQVWVLGYNKAEAIVDWEILLEEFPDPDAAIKFAKAYAGEGKYNSLNIPEDVAYLEVLVETVVDFDDYDENVETLYCATIKFE